ncbi:Ig-like domain-containing protein [Panacibacter ginsenosidivorans]|uniref:Ig-like domain-containing protein n=1 Tax=Panacibacter ginsenosidivorans TaxID=1813871 RepID=UPI00131528C6|nr:PKD domain-containing protein [Panacibacter ginsenosidivorans]
MFAQAPAIISFSPTTVCQGDAVTITGTNFTGIKSVKLGTDTASKFTVNSATSITAYVSVKATTGTVIVTTGNGADTTTEKLTINPLPVPGLADINNPDAPFTYCNGLTTTYTLVVGNSTTQAGSGASYDIDWGDGSAHFTQTDWAANAQTTHTYTNQGYFKIKFTVTTSNGCSKTATYNFYNGTNPLASITTTASTVNLCAPADVTFVIGNWANNSPGTTYQLDFGDGTSPVTLQHPLNNADTAQQVTHTYKTSSCPKTDYTAILQPTNACYTTTYTVNQIIIRDKPIADFAIDTPVCVTDAVCFTNKTTDGSSGNNCNTISNYTWDFGDGSTSTATTPPCHNYTDAGTYTVTLTSSNATCGGDIKTKTVVVKETSQSPVVSATPVSYCQDETAVQLTATGTGLLWYTSVTGGTGTSVAPTPSTAIPGTTTYYVSQTLAGKCESPRVPVTVVVHAIPAEPGVSTPVNLCKGQAATPLTATGTGLLWYTTAIGGTGSSTAPTPSTAATGTFNFYVSQTVSDCESKRAVITVNVESLPGAPVVVSPIIYCQNQPAVPLTASGTGLRWYTTATGGTGSTVAPTPSTTTVGNSDYYVSQSTNCGEGPRALITVTTKAAPSATISYPVTNLCNVNNTAQTPNPPVNVNLTGSTGGTYTISPSPGLPVNASTGTIDPSGATAGTYTIYYRITGTGGCSDFVTSTTVTVNSTPNASITYPSICTSNGDVKVQLTGSSGGSYTSTAGLTINAATGTITASTSIPGNYVVTYTIAPSSPCPGFTTTTNVTVTKAPSATITYNVSNLCNVTNTASTPNPPIDVVLTGNTGGTYSIQPATGLPINTINGRIDPSGAAAGTYTISYTIPGSGGCTDFVTTATVTVNGTPEATISYPPICTSTNAISVQLNGTQGGSFSSTTGLTIDAATGVITASTSTAGDYIVTYSIAASAPCPGFTTTTKVTITKAPFATISYAATNLCNVINSANTPNPKVDVMLTGNKGGTYTVSPSTGLPINTVTGTIDPSGAVAGTYTISYTIAAAGGCAEFVTTTQITINSTPTAAIQYPASSYCRGVTIPQAVTFSGTTGGTYSSAQGLSVNSTTGAINPSLSLPGTYTVTYTIQPSAPCPGFVTTTTVTINDSPVITFSSLVQSICSGGTAVFKPLSTVANTLYTWSVTSALPAGVTGVTSGTTSDPNASISLLFTNTSSVSQSIIIHVVPTNPTQNPCDGAPTDLTLIINPIPAALVTDTFKYCMHTPPETLTVNAVPGNTVNWYDGNLNPLNAAPLINTNTPATFTFYASQSNSYGCESGKSKVTAVVNATAKIISSSYTNPTACGIPSGSIVLNVLDLNNNAMPNISFIVHYTKFQTAYAIVATSDANGKITIPLVAGTYSNIYVESNNCLSQKIPDVFVLKDPDPPAQPIAGYNGPLCSENMLSLSASSPTSSETYPIDYVWVGPAFGPLADTTRNTVISFPSAPVSYAGTYIVYAIQNNCISPATNFIVTIKQSPTKPQVTTRSPLCVGDNLSLQATSSIPGNSILSFVWNGPGTGFPVNNAYAAINNVQVQDGGVYSITVTSAQTGCSSTTDTLIKIGNYPIVKFAQDTLTVPTGYLLNLATTITNANDPNVLPMKSYAWTPSQNINCNDAICSAPVAAVKNAGCYYLNATNVYGCVGRDTICVKVFCQSSQVFMPNAFTPNGNASNAVFMVRASGIASVKSFRIFNRWGRLVFERTNFSPNSAAYGWNGLINGRPADVGVYIYTVDVICENGVPYTYKGNVTLLR